MQSFCKMSQRSILLLSSSRVHGHGYLEHSKELLTTFLGKRNVKTILFIPYALRDYEKYTMLVSDALTPWGYTVEGLHSKSDPVDAVKSAEAIFVGGGNTFVLLKTLYDRNLISTIRQCVLNEGLPYIGSSAGTNVATRSIHTTNDMPVAHPPTLDALALVSFNINPHYLDPEPETVHKGETRDERITEFLDYHRRPVVGLREGTALLIEGDSVTLVGDRRMKLFHSDKTTEEYAPNSDLSFLLKA